MRPNDLSLGLEMSPMLVMNFFCCTEELSGLFTSYGIARWACAGFFSMWVPLVAPPRSRVLKGRNSASVATGWKNDLDEMMLCESLSPSMVFSEVVSHADTVSVLSEMPGTIPPALASAMRVQRRSHSSDLASAHERKSAGAAAETLPPGVADAAAKTRRSNAVNENVRIVATLFFECC
jgi:hypothetical protein